MLIYLTLFIVQCLKRIERAATKAEAAKALVPLASGTHLLPGDAGWPLGTLIPQPKTVADTGAQLLRERVCSVYAL